MLINPKPGDDYWAATEDFWAAVHAEWARVAATKNGIAIKEEAETGTVIAGTLLEIADDIANGRMSTATAIGAAKKLIDANTHKL